ncbi:HCP-like protein [Polyporus arcularius HHB13444]|uniref:HCP-like protein n=1 Tax=Polyporus arcularius HHB13444 TaxID=1314778 RepID=A0A5C3PB37_9APHY|nr:HCP-like protein [Polyporus arcularius HHB13444]
MRNSPYSASPVHSPAHSPAASPRQEPSPLGSPALGPSAHSGSRPVSPASIREQQPYSYPYPSPTPSPNIVQSPASVSLHAQTPGSDGQSPRITSSVSVYSNYSYYELPPTPTSANLNGPSSPAQYAPNTPTTPAMPGTPGRQRAKSTASRHKEENPVPANPQTPQDFLQLGIKHHLENRLTESAQAFEKSATLGGGCGVGMLMWGLAQRHGWGCPKDEATGFKWLRRAAELAVTDMEKGQHGDMSAVRSELVLAIYEVGQSFFRGWGVQKDKEMAVQYYRVASRLGDPDAQQELAFCLEHGKGCKKDKKEAAKWYRAAVQQGASDVGLAWIYKEKYQ